MALNITGGQLDFNVKNLKCVPTSPATPASGDPCVFNNIAGVAETAQDTDGLTLINTNCMADLLVDGVDQSGNSAVAAGDTIYYTSGDTIKLSKKNTGVKFGTAISSAVLTTVGALTRTGTLVASGNHVTIISVWVGKVGG